jgi:hypothetical protein
VNRKVSCALASIAAVVAIAIVPTAASALPAGSGPITITAASLGGKPPQPIGGVRPQLCEYTTCGGTPSALWFATAWSVVFWGGSSTGEFCTGPYGNGSTHYQTQWACYGTNSNAPRWEWQVNVDPYGNETYANEYAIYIG